MANDLFKNVPDICYWRNPTHLKNGILKFYKEKFGHDLTWDDHQFFFAQFCLFYCQMHTTESRRALNLFTYYLRNFTISSEEFVSALRQALEFAETTQYLPIPDLVDIFTLELEIIAKKPFAKNPKDDE